ncbi:MAG TPA: ribosome biogenesis GTPase Der [Candidatus Binataceae bacterium]|nr:ribosome biogenesis GTPase Der [Candidatus Binataceae bacterium]
MARISKASAEQLHAAAGDRPLVVIAGRANAGKSTLFNRISRRGRAITSAIAGTTRDLNLAAASYDEHEFVVADSGGLELYASEPETERATEEALRAVAGATVVVLVVDGRAGIAGGDREVLALIRQTGRPIIVAVNKIDHPGQDAVAAEAYALGVPTVINISAAHGRGIEELLEAIVALLPPAGEASDQRPPDLRFALIGRPNVGKSSLFNRLAGYERAIVADRPGTTRDPIDIRLEDDGQSLLLVDTAGIRRPGKVEGELEQHSVGRAIETIRRAEVLAMVIDATEGITDQDTRLAHLVETNDRALIIICNKWDAAAAAGRKVAAFVRQARDRYPFLGFAPMLFTSAITGDGVKEIIPAALRAGAAWRSRFQTAMLNKVLADALAAMDPPLVAGRRLKLMYVTQVASNPPRLAFFTNLERDIPAHYVRFLEGRFRAALNLEDVGTPLRFEFRRAGRSAEGRKNAIIASRAD